VPGLGGDGGVLVHHVVIHHRLGPEQGEAAGAVEGVVNQITSRDSTVSIRQLLRGILPGQFVNTVIVHGIVWHDRIFVERQ
jgi:hypothetical protein